MCLVITETFNLDVKQSIFHLMHTIIDTLYMKIILGVRISEVWISDFLL